MSRRVRIPARPPQRCQCNRHRRASARVCCVCSRWLAHVEQRDGAPVASADVREARVVPRRDAEREHEQPDLYSSSDGSVAHKDLVS